MNNKNNIISIRINHEQEEILKEISAHLGSNRSTAIKLLIETFYKDSIKTPSKKKNDRGQK